MRKDALEEQRRKLYNARAALGNLAGIGFRLIDRCCAQTAALVGTIIDPASTNDATRQACREFALRASIMGFDMIIVLPAANARSDAASGAASDAVLGAASDAASGAASDAVLGAVLGASSGAAASGTDA